MKKLAFALLTIMLFFAAFSGAAEAPKDSGNEFFLKKSVELTCVMDELAESEEYIAMLSSAVDLTDLIDDLSSGEYTHPESSVLVRVSDETVSKMVERLAGRLELSNDAYDMVLKRFAASAFPWVNAAQGAMTLATTSILSVAKVYAERDILFDNMYVLLLYEKYSSVTYFENSGEGIISASTLFLFLDDSMKEAVSDGEVADYLIEYGLIGEFDVEYIDGGTIDKYL